MFSSRTCPLCGGFRLITDVFEEEELVWCGDCGKNITQLEDDEHIIPTVKEESL